MESVQGRKCWLALVLAGISNVEGLDGVAIMQIRGDMKKHLPKGKHVSTFLCFLGRHVVSEAFIHWALRETGMAA